LLELLATGRRSCALAAATLLVAALAGASPGGAAPAANRKAAKEFSDTLPTLTTAREAHGLSAEAAQRAYPVHLRGVVAYFDPDSGGGKAAMFVQDTSGSVYVQPPAGEVGSLSAGALVDVEGLSSPGMFAPIVTGHEIKVMGHPGLPAQAPRVGMEQLMTGAEDGQWVEVEGTVHDVSETGHHIVLQLALPEGTISVTTVWQPDALYYSLIGAQVRVRAIASPVINGSSQMIGVRLLMPNLSAMEVVKAAPGDPFLQPAVPIDNLLRWDHIADSLGRVHLRGRVTLQWPGSLLCLRDATRGICAQTAQDALIAIGDVVDVVGFATAENGVPVLTDASFRSAHSNGYVAAQPITARQALQGKNESDLVQIDAQLIGGDLESANVTLLLTSGQAVFVAVLPMSLGGTSAARWKIGSKVRVTGICSVLMDAQKDAARNGTARAKTFRILMRSPDDVIVLMRPSWWTPAHTLVVLSLAFAVMLSILGWVAALRRRVNQQTRLLRESEERFRQMAQHDALTGLATRLVLRDRLSVAGERQAAPHRAGAADGGSGQVQADQRYLWAPGGRRGVADYGGTHRAHGAQERYRGAHGWGRVSGAAAGPARSGGGRGDCGQGCGRIIGSHCSGGQRGAYNRERRDQHRFRAGSGCRYADEECGSGPLQRQGAGTELLSSVFSRACRRSGEQPTVRLRGMRLCRRRCRLESAGSRPAGVDRGAGNRGRFEPDEAVVATGGGGAGGGFCGHLRGRLGPLQAARLAPVQGDREPLHGHSAEG
jgi:hypothetical protein